MSVKQKVTKDEKLEQDVICVHTKDHNACVMVFFVRRGRLIGREIFTFELLEDTKSEIITQFIPQFYSHSHIPKEIILSDEIEQEELYTSWLSNKAGHRVKLIYPQKGYKHELINMLYKNVIDYMEKYFEKSMMKKRQKKTLLEELADLIKFSGELFRIEAYDISNISGTNSVAGMVVYEAGEKKKSDYRKFNIKSVQGADDYASMAEVIRRRFLRLLSPENETEDLEESAKSGGGENLNSSVV